MRLRRPLNSRVMPFELASSYEPQGDQGEAIERVGAFSCGGKPSPDTARGHWFGKDVSPLPMSSGNSTGRLLSCPTTRLWQRSFTASSNSFSRTTRSNTSSAISIITSLEAYIPRTDTYIEKDSSINEEIERLRLSAVSSLLSRRDTIVVASVSCIYGLASPEDFLQMLVTIKQGQMMTREALLAKLVDMLYERNDIAFGRGKFRVRGDVVEVHQAQVDEEAIRVEFFGDEIDRISQFDPLTGRVTSTLSTLTIYPAKQFVTPYDKLQRAMRSIREELDQRVTEFGTREQTYRGATRQAAHGI